VPSLPRIYPDANVYLDLITRNEDINKSTGEERWRGAVALFDGIFAREAEMIASPLIEAEVLCNGNARLRRERSTKVRERLQTWFIAPDTIWVDIDRYLVREAVRLRDSHGSQHEKGSKPFGATDALHLAAALRAKCDYFMTCDEGFPLGQTVDGMKIIRPGIVWQEKLRLEME
jgi:predicted nucleic acid-binding protein